jgi:hypothetical protein
LREWVGVYLELARLAAGAENTALLRRMVDAVIPAEAAANTIGSGIERAARDLLRTMRPGPISSTLWVQRMRMRKRNDR